MCIVSGSISQLWCSHVYHSSCAVLHEISQLSNVTTLHVSSFHCWCILQTYCWKRRHSNNVNTDSPWPCWWIPHPGTRLCQRRLLGTSWCACSRSIYPLGCQSAPAGTFPLVSWHREGWPHAALSADHRHIYTHHRTRPVQLSGQCEVVVA